MMKYLEGEEITLRRIDRRYPPCNNHPEFFPVLAIGSAFKNKGVQIDVGCCSRLLAITT